MKKNKIFMMIVYLLVPIIVAVISLSILAKFFQNDENFYLNQSQYFQTNNFVSNYMSTLSSYANQLIYNNEVFPITYDGEIQISYMNEEDSNHHYIDSNIQDHYILICYQNKALTNVELTMETNTIEKIKNYIASQENAKKANILAGNIEADSEIILNKALKYYDDFENTYYTIEGKETAYRYYGEESDNDIEESRIPVRKYINTTIQDFAIYSSYKEALVYNTDLLVVRELMKNYQNLAGNIHLILPIGMVLLLLMFFYLVIVIGRTKKEGEIDMNDFDKIPYEIIWTVAMFAFAMCAAMINIPKHTDMFVSMLISVYCVAYIVCAVLFHTTVKRIKARMLIKSTLLYICVMWFVKICQKIKDILGIWFDKTTAGMDLVKRLILAMIGYLIISVILMAMMQGFGFLLAGVLGIYLFSKIVRRIRDFAKMEQHLKEMYEGTHPEDLNVENFTPEFQNSILYINDISNGFENAIQEQLKSERMKAELITNVSHDIKTPLTSIINYVDLLKKEKIENDKAKEYIGVLESKSQRLKKLTEDLIEASKASSGNVKLKMEKINIVQLMKQAIGEFEDKFKASNLQVITKFESEEIFIYADNRYIYRIVENIFSNVAKYSMENSRVYMDIAKKGEKVYIDTKNISKNTLNISEEELMQRFVRGDKSRTMEGSGLGLSISKSLAEIQNGELSIKIDGDLFKVELCFDLVK